MELHPRTVIGSRKPTWWCYHTRTELLDFRRLLLCRQSSGFSAASVTASELTEISRHRAQFYLCWDGPEWFCGCMHAWDTSGRASARNPCRRLSGPGHKWLFGHKHAKGLVPSAVPGPPEVVHWVSTHQTRGFFCPAKKKIPGVSPLIDSNF